MKLAAKFTILLVTSIVILFLVDGHLMVQRDIRVFDDDMQRDAQKLSEKLRPLVLDHWQQGGHQEVDRFLDRLNDIEGLADELVRVRWVFLDTRHDPEFSPLVSDAELKPVVHRSVFSIKREEQGRLHMITYTTVEIGNTRRAALEVLEPVTHPAQRRRVFGRRLIILSATTLLLGVGVVVLLGTEFVGRPLRLLIDKTRRIGDGDLSGPIQLKRRDEFGELASAINSMCNDLVEAQEKVGAETAARIAVLEELRHADRLRTVGRLASGIAHEIGTPLNVVGGRAEMIASGSLSPEDTKKSAQTIKAESDRITTIIRDLLDFARQTTPKRSDVNLLQVVRQTCKLLEPLAERRGINIVCVAQDESYPCHVDAGKMQQVLMNLIVNAGHSMPDGGSIKIDLQRQTVDRPEAEGAVAGEYLLLSVRDTGLGISEEDLPQVFEPFFTTKDVGEGTGLGLSVAYGIAVEHGGWINAESEIGEGSRFTVYLPLEVEA